MRTPSLVVPFIIFLATLSIANSSFTFIKPISLTLGNSSARRDIQLVAGNSTSWSYRACIADSVSTGKVYTLHIFSENSTVVEGTAPNDGINNDDLTVIQGLDECAYAGLINSSLVNQVLGDSLWSDLPTRAWRSPFYAVWLNNSLVQTFLYSDDLVISRVNATTDGPHTFTPVGIENMDMIFSWQLYQDPTSQMFYIVYSESRNDNSLIWNTVVQKCAYDCVREGPIGGGAFATITANATHWFSCYIGLIDNAVDHVILKGRHLCTMAGQLNYNEYSLHGIDLDYPLNMTRNAPMYSCMIGSTTMILAVSSTVSQVYSLYSLDTANGFNITDKSLVTGNLTVMSMACKDQVILVSTKNGIDYWAWDDGSGLPFAVAPINTPTGSAPTTEPANAPTLTTPVVDPPSSGVNQPNSSSGELTTQNKVLVGVLVGVGVPLMAGAIVLILMRKKLRKQKKKSEDPESIYSAIKLPSKDDPLFEKKMLIPYKQLNIGKSIGAGSFGKVFLGKWRGATVAVKMSNQFSSPENFSAEAKLTLSMPPHPNLVQTYGVCTDAEYPLIVLEYCEGGSLDKIVFNQTLDQKEQRALVLGIAYGLLHLHEHKIIHRDLAARNILLKEGIPKICDFGMSRTLKEEALQGKTYSPIGPIRWMAPESVNDMSYSYKSDVWTFGIVVSEIVNGHEPYEGENQLDVAMKIRDQGCTPSILDDCDPVLAELMQMCWKVNPDDRPTMNDLVIFLNNKFALS